MDRRIKNAEIFADTANLCKKIKRLQDCINSGNENQKQYFDEVRYDGSEKRSVDTDVIVSGKRSFEAAAPYARAESERFSQLQQQKAQRF